MENICLNKRFLWRPTLLGLFAKAQPQLIGSCAKVGFLLLPPSHSPPSLDTLGTRLLSPTSSLSLPPPLILSKSNQNTFQLGFKVVLICSLLGCLVSSGALPYLPTYRILQPQVIFLKASPVSFFHRNHICWVSHIK